MKKILSIILILCCILGVCSCNGIGNSSSGDEEATEGFANFEKAIANASASAVIVTVKTTTAIGELNSKYEVYYGEDNSATIKYYYERFNEIGEGEADEIVTKTEGVLYRDADGKYSVDVGVDVSAVQAAAAFNIAPLRSTATVNAAGDVLTVNVPKISAPDVFGMQFASNVDLKIVLRDGNLSTMTLTSTDKTITYTYDNK